MTSTLHQLTLSFDPSEDRVLLRIGTSENTEYQLWLTRRFLKITWLELMGSMEKMVEIAEPLVSDSTVSSEEVRDEAMDQDVDLPSNNIQEKDEKLHGNFQKEANKIVRDKVTAVEHKEAIASSNFRKEHVKDNINLTSESGPLLVVGCQIKPIDGNNIILSLKTKDRTGIKFGLNKELLHALCHMIISSSEKAEWGLNLKVGNPNVLSPKIAGGVIH